MLVRLAAHATLSESEFQYILECFSLLFKLKQNIRAMLQFAKLNFRVNAMEKRIIELESKLAFQEHTIHELNEVVTQQQQQIEALQRAIEALKDRIKSLNVPNIASESEETPPPHY